MRRQFVSGAVAAAVLAAVGAGLAWARPGWVVELRRWGEQLAGAAPARPVSEDAARPAVVDEVEQLGWCGPHRRPEADCGPCDGGKAATAACREALPAIRIDSADLARRIGIETEAVAMWRHAPHTLAANAETAYAAHDYAHILPRVAGRIVAVPKDEGEFARKGEVVVVVDAAEVGGAKAHYLGVVPLLELARKTHDRLATLVRQNAAAAKGELEALAALNRAQAAVLDAKQVLVNLGYTATDLDAMVRAQDTSGRLEVVAPLSGVLVERHAVMGEAVQPTTSLFEQADLTHLWAWADVNESAIDQVKIGQPARFTIAGTTAPVFSGQVELIGFAVNPATRTVQVRIDLKNPDGRLRANQFGRAEIRVEPEHDTRVVPRSAVQRDDHGELVFLPRPDGRTFDPRRVVTRPIESPGLVEVGWGLDAGQVVVTTGSFVLKSELLRDRIAGDE